MSPKSQGEVWGPLGWPVGPTKVVTVGGSAAAQGKGHGLQPCFMLHGTLTKICKIIMKVDSCNLDGVLQSQQISSSNYTLKNQEN